MTKKRGQEFNDALNLLVAGGVCLFSLLIGGSLLVGLAAEPDKRETFLVVLGFGLLFSGMGCGFYCCHLLTKRAYPFIYPFSLALTILGYGLALIALAMYG
ncbi:MAG TPA: hypothetical protein VNA19_05465 [Pyrinomonadaceae bacterium]|jgi:hypothetical protein|nr:hypothetical protein [Pyrinomonadaceae bacterium]